MIKNALHPHHSALRYFLSHIYRRALIFGRHKRVEFRIAIACGVFWLLVSQFYTFNNTELLVFDSMTLQESKNRPLDPSLKLVAIDEESLHAMNKMKGWNWPWPRSAYADMIIYLESCGVKEISIDMFFTSASGGDAESDDELRAVLAATNNVRIAQTSEQSIFQPTFDARVPATVKGELSRYNLQGQLISWPSPYSILNQIGNDKEASKNRLILSAVEIVTRGLRLKKPLPPDDRVKPDRLRELWTHPPALPPLPADAQDPAVDSDNLRGKVIFIATTVTAGFDLHAFPTGDREPGVMFQLANRSNQINNQFITELSFGMRSLLVLASSLLAGGLYVRFSSPRIDAAWTVLVAISIALMTRLAFHFYLWIPPLASEAALLTSFATGASFNYIRESQKRRKTADLFGKFVSKKMVQRLIEQQQEVTLGGEKAELTIMFSDLSGFTTLSETMTSDRLVALLNEYLDEMSQKIVQQEGTLDKYIGDAILAFWGAPDPSKDHAWRACHAALDCQKRLGELAPEWERQFGAKMYARLGLNTDIVTVGLIGSRHLHNYSVIGDAVNLASRLEGANKKFGTTIMIAQRTVDLAEGKIEVRPIALLQVKGKTQPVAVYELLAKAGELTAIQKQIQYLSTLGYQFHLKQLWDDSEAIFKQVLDLDPEDPLILFYIQYVKKLRKTPLPQNWNGVLILDEK